MKKKASHLISTIVLTVNMVFVALLLASAYGGLVNPNAFPWMVALTLGFPFFLVINMVFVLVWLVVMSRKWLWSFIAILACAVQIRTYCPVNMSQPIPKGSVKVVSYNVHGFGGAPEDSAQFHLMLQFLRQSDADILCLQEGQPSTKNKDEVNDALAHWTHRDTIKQDSVHISLMLCTDYPIIDRKVLPSPSEGHACVVYRLKVDGDTIVVVNSHFVSNAMNNEDKKVYRELLTAETDSIDKSALNIFRKVNEAGMKRATQADTLAGYLRTLPDYPVIVCGDFNDSPLSYVHHQLTRTFNDAYTAAGNGPGITYHLSGMFFRLDNILCSRHWRSFRANVGSQHKMSDHYPIEAWLKLTQ